MNAIADIASSLSFGAAPECEAYGIGYCDPPLRMAAYTVHAFGEFNWDSSGHVCGYRARAVFPNATWREVSESTDDCLIAFQATGSVEQDVDSFDYRFHIRLSRDDAQTTCLEENTGPEPAAFDEDYYLSVADDDSATLLLAPEGVGNEIGYGVAAEGRATFAYPGGCLWLGAATCP